MSRKSHRRRRPKPAIVESRPPPSVKTCLDCKHCRKCLEWSRLYPCKDFKTKAGEKNDKQGNKRLPQKQADH